MAKTAVVEAATLAMGSKQYEEDEKKAEVFF